MSVLVPQGNATGTGINNLIAPASNNNNNIVLPDRSGTLAMDGPAFSAILSANQTGVSANTWTKVTFNAEDFDTANCFDSATNYRFTPNVAGYYQFNLSIAAAASANVAYASIYKNGNNAKLSSAGDAFGTHVSFSALIPMNGTTDYVEGWVYSSAAQTIVAGSGTYSFFQGVFARGL